MNKLINVVTIYFANLFQEWREHQIGLKITKLKKQADKLREQTGSQMFVLKWDGKIQIISKRWFKKERQKGTFPKNFTADKLKSISFYYTRA